MRYEAPRIENTRPVAAVLTYGGKWKKNKRSKDSSFS